jgi:hypothetical protein
MEHPVAVHSKLIYAKDWRVSSRVEWIDSLTSSFSTLCFLVMFVSIKISDTRSLLQYFEYYGRTPGQNDVAFWKVNVMKQRYDA